MGGHIALESEYLAPEVAESTDLIRMWSWEIDYVLEAEDHLVAWLESVLVNLEP